MELRGLKWDFLRTNIYPKNEVKPRFLVKQNEYEVYSPSRNRRLTVNNYRRNNCSEVAQRGRRRLTG
jgi:hypothetical protein